MAICISYHHSSDCSHDHRMPRKVDNHWCLGYAKMKWSHTNKSQSYSPIAVGVCQSVGSDSSPLYLGWILLNMVCSGCQLGTSSNPKMPKKSCTAEQKGCLFHPQEPQQNTGKVQLGSCCAFLVAMPYFLC